MIATVVAVWPAQPAHAAIPVTVDVATVYYYGGSHITTLMRVDLPVALRARGTCKMRLVKITKSDLGNGLVGTAYTLVATHVTPCEYSTNPQWGDRRAIWDLDYPYGSSEYSVKAEFIYGDLLYGYQYYHFTTVD